MNKSRDIFNEAELIRRIRDGDKEAFSVLFRTYYSDLCVFVQRYINLPATCENLIQDLFLNIWLQRSQWHPKGTARSYLYKAAQNRAFDYLRHQKVERICLQHHKVERELEWELYKSGQYHQDSHLDQSVDRKLLADIQKAVNKLPERMKLIFTLNRDEGLSYSEIADVLEVSVKTVEAQMGRALKSLREQLSDFFHMKRP